MAAIFIVAGLAIADKMEKKKEAKRQKKARDEARYRELQMETNQRLARQNSATDSPNTSTTINSPQDTFVENPEEYDEEDEYMNTTVDNGSPPPYEDAVTAGERREREWQAQMQRRRSSVTSNQSQRGGVNYLRMG